MIHPDVAMLFREALEPRQIVRCINDFVENVDTRKMSPGNVITDMRGLRNLALVMATDAGQEIRAALGLAPCK